jgi:hypothetical protein
LHPSDVVDVVFAAPEGYQDRSIAAQHLYGVLPEAGQWLEYLLPRLDRAIAAMPRDGVIPPAVHMSLDFYVEEPTEYRAALLSLTGRDIFDADSFRAIVDFTDASLNERDMVLENVAHGDQSPLTAGSAFLNAMASKCRDGRAARISRLVAAHTPSWFFHNRQKVNHYCDKLRGFMSYDPSVRPLSPCRPERLLLHFEDSGFVRYADENLGVSLSLRCGPLNGRHAYRHSTCSCDRLGDAPGAGHFVLNLRGKPRLVTPESAYRLHTFLRSCLLVDGKGQKGDVGYPMSIPSVPDYGEEIESAEWDDDSNQGRIRLNLKPAYPDSMGMASYMREFVFTGARKILVRDEVVLDSPHALSWLFQSKREFGIRLDGLRARFGEEPALVLEPSAFGVDLRAAVCETDVVWAYATPTGGRPFDHVRYDSLGPTASAMAEFALSW